jgi:macrodomain Ter protein organizer (MatP/YcbG family)
MPRTTVDIDAEVLRKLKAIQRRDRKTLGEVTSELLARAIASEAVEEDLAPLKWPSKAVGLKVDLEDKEALWRILDER